MTFSDVPSQKIIVIMIKEGSRAARTTRPGSYGAEVKGEEIKQTYSTTLFSKIQRLSSDLIDDPVQSFLESSSDPLTWRGLLP